MFIQGAVMVRDIIEKIEKVNPNVDLLKKLKSLYRESSRKMAPLMPMSSATGQSVPQEIHDS